jgi:hypothetical protein
MFNQANVGAILCGCPKVSGEIPENLLIVTDFGANILGRTHIDVQKNNFTKT